MVCIDSFLKLATYGLFCAGQPAEFTENSIFASIINELERVISSRNKSPSQAVIACKGKGLQGI